MKNWSTTFRGFKRTTHPVPTRVPEAPLKTPSPELRREGDHQQAATVIDHPWQLGLPQGLKGRFTGKIPFILAVGGGKGGVGKSMVSANLSSKLAVTGRKVLALDLDIGGANLHSYFGIGQPARNLADAMILGRSSLADAILPTRINGLDIIAGGREEVWGSQKTLTDDIAMGIWQFALNAKSSLGYDIVVFDLGAGTHRDTTGFFVGAHLGLLTVLPEPTSIENAYMFLRASLLRLIENCGGHLENSEAAAQMSQLLTHGLPGRPKPKTCAAGLLELNDVYPKFIQAVQLAIQSRTMGVIVNQARSQRDSDIASSMEMITRSYFGLRAASMGYLNYDDAAWKSLRNRRLLTQDFPQSILSRRLTELAAKVTKLVREGESQ